METKKIENKEVKEKVVLVFENHPPLKILKENLNCVKDFNQDFGHNCIYLIHSPRSGKYILYTSKNSGCSYGNHSPKTHKNIKGVFDTKEGLILFLRKGLFNEEYGENDFETAGEILEKIGGVEDF